jgi:DNA-binding FrmR family transcriptional regulator
MELKNPETKTKLVKRLRRIEGQVRGIQNMLEEERDCREIMQQLAAVSSAVKSTSRSFFQDYALMCLSEREGETTDQELLAEMVDLLDKTP